LDFMLGIQKRDRPQTAQAKGIEGGMRSKLREKKGVFDEKGKKLKNKGRKNMEASFDFPI